jgi:hypothetical protein
MGMIPHRLSRGPIELDVVGADGDFAAPEVLGEDAADFAVADEGDVHVQSM